MERKIRNHSYVADRREASALIYDDDEPLLKMAVNADAKTANHYDDDDDDDDESDEITPPEAKYDRNWRPLIVVLILTAVYILAFVSGNIAALNPGHCAAIGDKAMAVMVRTLPLTLCVGAYAAATWLGRRGRLGQVLSPSGLMAQAETQAGPWKAQVWRTHDGQLAFMQPHRVTSILLVYIIGSLALLLCMIMQVNLGPYNTVNYGYDAGLGGYPGINVPDPQEAKRKNLSRVYPDRQSNSSWKDHCAGRPFHPDADGRSMDPFNASAQALPCRPDWQACAWAPCLEQAAFARLMGVDHCFNSQNFTDQHGKPGDVAGPNPFIAWFLSPITITSLTPGILFATRAFSTIQRQSVTELTEWRIGHLSGDQRDRVGRILTPHATNGMAVGPPLSAGSVVHALLWTVFLSGTFFFMPRILNRADPPIIHSAVSFNDGGTPKPGLVITLGVVTAIATFWSFLQVLQVWLTQLPSDVANARLSALTKELRDICSNGAIRRGGSYNAAVVSIEKWFDLRRHVVIATRAQFRAVESCLKGDILILVMIVLFAIAYIAPSLIQSEGLGGDAGTIQFSLPMILLNGLLLAIRSIYLHTWPLIYTSGDEVAQQTQIIADVAIRMQTRHAYGLGEVEMSDSEVTQSYTYFEKLESRLSLTDHDQPTVFGIAIQPTLKNAILGSGATVVLSLVYAVFGRFV